MKRIITGSLAKRADGFAINELGIPSLKLMDRAAASVARYVMALAEEEGLKKDCEIAVFAGAGNNGADGVLCAVKLLSEGFLNTEVYFCGKPEKRSEEFVIQLDKLRALGREIRDYDSFQLSEKRPSIVIDALFGIGLKREVKGAYAECIELMNRIKDEAGAYIVSVDVPSGLNSDDGQNMCPRPADADITVTFGYGKTGFYLNYGYGNCGEIFVEDIGYPKDLLSKLAFTEGELLFLMEEGDLKKLGLGERDPRANKSDYGKAVLAAGSRGMAGAAFLSGLAAFKTGAGMVKYLGPEENRTILQTLIPEVMYDAFTSEESESELFDKVKDSIAWAGRRGCVVLGPGLGTGEQSKKLVRTVVSALSEHNKREPGSTVFLVADGDALNVISGERELLKDLGGFTVITPHVGEMSRLTGKTIGEIKADPVGAAVKFFNDTGINIILKDYVSVVIETNREIFINTSGNAALAKAGSGDVLTGILAALIMRNGGLKDSLSEAAYIHGRAGVKASEIMGLNGTLARDIALSLPSVIESF